MPVRPMPPELAPGLVAVAALLALAAGDAGFKPTAWYPAGLILLGLLTLVVVLRPVQLRRPAALALGALVLFTVWSFASIAWSDVRGEAWDGSNRTLIYLIGFALFLLLPLPRGAPLTLVGLYGVGIALLALATLIRVAYSADPGTFFIDGRLAEPAGYPNAACALFLGAYWPLLALATRRELTPALRGACLGAGIVLLGAATLTQSRASAIAAALTALVYLAVVPGRARGLVALALSGGALIAVAPVLLDVYPALVGDGDDGHTRRALLAVVSSALVAGLLGWVLARLDERVSARAPVARRVRIAAAAAATLAVLAIGVGALVASGDPVERVGDGWAEFKRGQGPQSTTSNLGSGLGSNRYDFWRVALLRFSDRPLTGVGADNFAADYLRERRSDEEPLYPHSLELGVLSGLGLPGALLFSGFCAAAVVAARRAGRDRLERAALLGGLVGSAYWLIHGSVDWFYSFPGLTLPALAWLGLAANSGGVSPAERPVRRPVRISTALLALPVAALFASGWIAARDMASASTDWPSDPPAAFARLDRARTLDPFSDRPDLVEGVIASALDDLPRMRRSFGRALERNPSGWFARLELALVAAETDRRDEALAHIAAARRLNPREIVLREVQRRLVQGEQPSRRLVEGQLRERVEARGS